MVDSNIGPYKVIRKMSEDRFGQVFEAIDPTRKKRVVIKSLRHEAASRPEVVARLYSEAQTLALLNHPNIARLYGFVRANDNLYLVMEFVEGASLRAILQEKGRLEPHLALAIFHQILSAVKFAHELGVIHGDLKPSNIMVASFAQIKVLDFAIAPILGDLDIDPQVSSAPYTAPEHMGGAQLDARSDTYSLGVLLYESIVGKLPCNNTTSGEQPRSMPPPSTVVAKCPPWLDGFLLRALAPSPADRFQSVAAMAQAMGPSFAARRRRRFLEPARAWIRHGAQRISSGPLVVIAGAKQTSKQFATHLSSAAEVARQIPASLIGSLQRGVAVVNPGTWTKRGASRMQAWTRNNLSPWTPRSRVLGGRLNERFNGLAHHNWKRYAVLATLLVSVFIETFVFRGANTLLSPEINSIPALNRTGGVQGILETIDPGPAPAIEIASQPEPQPKAVRRANPGGRARRGADELHHQAVNSKRTVTYRATTENNLSRPAVPEAKVTEQKRNPENNMANMQLNVRWEN